MCLNIFFNVLCDKNKHVFHIHCNLSPFPFIHKEKLWYFFQLYTLITLINSMGRNIYALFFVYISLWSLSLHHSVKVSFTKNNGEVISFVWHTQNLSLVVPTMPPPLFLRFLRLQWRLGIVINIWHISLLFPFSHLCFVTSLSTRLDIWNA